MVKILYFKVEKSGCGQQMPKGLLKVTQWVIAIFKERWLLILSNPWLFHLHTVSFIVFIHTDYIINQTDKKAIAIIQAKVI